MNSTRKSWSPICPSDLRFRVSITKRKITLFVLVIKGTSDFTQQKKERFIFISVLGCKDKFSGKCTDPFFFFFEKNYLFDPLIEN